MNAVGLHALDCCFDMKHLPSPKKKCVCWTDKQLKMYSLMLKWTQFVIMWPQPYLTFFIISVSWLGITNEFLEKYVGFVLGITNFLFFTFEVKAVYSLHAIKNVKCSLTNQTEQVRDWRNKTKAILICVNFRCSWCAMKITWRWCLCLWIVM